jgi:hypothetical protein
MRGEPPVQPDHVRFGELQAQRDFVRMQRNPLTRSRISAYSTFGRIGLAFIFLVGAVGGIFSFRAFANSPRISASDIVMGVSGTVGYVTICVVFIAHYRAHRRLYRLANHLCVQCGYNLIASPDRCPECGAAAPGPREMARAVPRNACLKDGTDPQGPGEQTDTA